MAEIEAPKAEKEWSAIDDASVRGLEIPLGKRTKLYRFLEILPGVLSYIVVILLFVLSWISPVLGAIYL